MIRNDVREKHEEEFRENNEKPLSVCSGVFFIGNRKHTIVCQNCAKCHKNKRYRMRIEDVPEVKFRHAESFRRCKLYEQTINEEYVTTVSVFNILYTNDLACSAILDLFDGIKYKDKESQKIYRAVYKRMKEYQKMVTKVIVENGNLDDFADFNSLMDEEAEPIVEEIHKMVYDEFESHDVEDAEYLARVELARTMVGYSIFSLQTRIQECRRYGVDLVYLRNYELNDIKKAMEGFSNWALRKVEHIDLSQDKFVLKMHELGKALTNYKKLTEFIDKTIDKDSFKENKE